jgi:hypothetical protein
MEWRVAKLREKAKEAGLKDEDLGDLGLKLFGFKKWNE